MQTALVIFLLLALCGFIAYIGDLLGRRLGKKRLSIFGLRPKHTAIVLTIVTGVLIAAVTFGSALLVVPGFRRTVMEGERLAGANSRLRREVRNLGSQRNALVVQIEQLATKNTDLSQQNSALSSESARLTTAKAELEKKNHLLTGKNSQLTSANAGLLKQRADLQRNNSALRANNNRLVGANSQLAASNSRLNQSNQRLVQEMKGLRVQRQEAVVARKKALAERAEALQQVDELKDNEYVVRRGQRIAYRPLPPNPPIELIRNAVSNLLYEARHPMGQSETRPLELERPRKYTGLADDETTFKDWIVQQAAAAKDQRIVVRLVATENAVKGRKIRARLDWYANELAFSRGQSIVETRIDGAGSIGTIVEQLVNFLQSDLGVAGAARDKKMDRGDKGYIGEMTYDQILAVCKEIQTTSEKTERVARLVARARQDTYMSGPLNLDLEVSPIGSSETTRR